MNNQSKIHWYTYQLWLTGNYYGMYRISYDDRTIAFCVLEQDAIFLCEVLNKFEALQKIQDIKEQVMNNGLQP